MNAPGRNEPCPCGSGKKYKKCCLSKHEVEAPPHTAAPAYMAEQEQINQALQLAIEHQSAGRLQEAAAIYQQVLQVQPDSADALHLLGLVAHKAGQPETALDLISKAIEIAPNTPLYYSNVGPVLIDLGLQDQAMACYRKAIELQSDHVEALNNIGHLLQLQGHFDEAAEQYKAALAIRPDFADAHYNLGNVYRAMKRSEDALACYRTALQYKVMFPDAHNNLGTVLKDLGRYDEARAHLLQALAIQPDYVEAYCNLGVLESEIGQLEAALTYQRQAIALKPDYPEAYYNLGCVLADMGRRNEAIECYQKAVELAPDSYKAYNNMAVMYRESGELEKAITCGEKALAIKPDFAEPYINIGNALSSLGRSTDAIESYRKATDFDSKHAGAYSNLLFSMLYNANITPATLSEEVDRYRRAIEDEFVGQWPKHANTCEPGRPLRIGYVSGDFRNHAIAYFIEQILANHNKSEFEIFCYYNHLLQDLVTERLRKFANHWRQVKTLSDEQMAALVQSDRIDILVDLSGHTALNRLSVFARKPAPVQVTWMGYCGTTGLSAMDYRLTDANLDPPGLTERFHTETLIRLPASAIFQPAAEAPAVERLPARSDNGFTFACLNNPSKLNEPVIALWSRILKAVPGSRMMLGNARAHQEKWLVDLFAKHGVEGERLLLQPRVELPEYLALHNQIDLALDPFPYTGGTTTMHALWMGVPVLTLTGNTSVSRGGAAIMGNFGLPQFVASDEEQYLERAIHFASNLAELEEIRHGLRERIAANPAGNPVAYTRALEDAYRGMWQKWCKTQEGK